MSHTVLNDAAAVVMAGGIGTRFWPVSTKNRPKQFVDFFGDHSLLQMSVERLLPLIPKERILVLTNADFEDRVRAQLPDLPKENIIGEPMRRDTAAAVCLGALVCKKLFGNPVMVTVTADHVIHPASAFLKSVMAAVRQADTSHALCTFGIKPTYPATGYGYLELGEEQATKSKTTCYRVLSFKEKPNLATAKNYVESNKFMWNSGMFVWKTDVVLKELNQRLHHHVQSIENAVQQFGTAKFSEALKRAFEPLSRISIDYGLMETAENVCCIVGEFSWNDVGGWEALKDFLPQDANNNWFRGKLITHQSTNNIAFCENTEEALMLVGVHDLVVARSGNKTLIAHKDNVQEIKHLVEKLGQE